MHMAMFIYSSSSHAHYLCLKRGHHWKFKEIKVRDAPIFHLCIFKLFMKTCTIYLKLYHAIGALYIKKHLPAGNICSACSLRVLRSLIALRLFICSICSSSDLILDASFSSSCSRLRALRNDLCFHILI